MKKISVLMLSIQLVFSSFAYAQDEEDIVKSTQNDILLVGAAGAAGAVLGLSTLSFVDKPSKHLANIWTGAALGVIAGVVFVAYNSAQKGQEDLQSSADFQTGERIVWHTENVQKLTPVTSQFGTEIWSANF